VKVRGEYVARATLIGVMGMLPVDACVSPQGSLVIAAHSGAPDWGSGPEGRGKLFKVAYSDHAQPQPVLAWCEAPREVRIAFDRPLDPETLRDALKSTRIEYGTAVAAGDRFETMRPGYAVVAAQLVQLRRTLAAHGLSFTPDRRTLILTTEPHSQAVSYALTLPGLGRPRLPDHKSKELGQVAEVDLAYNLGGCRAEWTPASGGSSWSGWLPHLDLEVARALTAQSADHDAFWPCLELPGTLSLHAQLRLTDLLRPAVQPGSAVDDRLPPESAVLVFRARGKLRVTGPSGEPEISTTTEGCQQVTYSIRAENGQLVPVEIALETGPGTVLEVDYHTSEDPRPRALQLARVLVPWAQANGRDARLAAALPDARIRAGNWRRGRETFYGQEAQCGRCHTVRGEGGKIGPDLSNLVERDYDSVTRDIGQPSAAINPDYVTFNLALTDGRVLSGPVRTEKTRLVIGNAKGEEIVVPRSDVEDMKPLAISVMPEGLPKILGSGRMNDLLTFLLTPPLAPAPIHRDGAPPARRQSEVDAVLQAGLHEIALAPKRPLRVLVVAGAKDHGIDEHDYPLWLERWSVLLRSTDDVNVATANDWPSPDELAQADVMVWYSANARWSAEKTRDLDAFFDRGGGLVVIHYALNGTRAPEELAHRIGLAWVDGRSKFRHGPLDVEMSRAVRHPITLGFESVHFVDETYWNLTGDVGPLTVLATGQEEGKPQPLLWTVEHKKGRVFCSVPGHYTWTFDDPLFRILILRAICWTARQDVDRLSGLATVGARIRGPAK
jgi:putative heme-binding domain-containing protein